MLIVAEMDFLRSAVALQARNLEIAGQIGRQWNGRGVSRKGQAS